MEESGQLHVSVALTPGKETSVIWKVGWLGCTLQNAVPVSLPFICKLHLSSVSGVQQGRSSRGRPGDRGDLVGPGQEKFDSRRGLSMTKHTPPPPAECAEEPVVFHG
jgi:hypothetical protein